MNVETIRFYERRGVIADPRAHTDANYRRYPPDVVARIRTVRVMRDLGFGLADAIDLLRLQEGPSNPGKARRIANKRMEEIDGKIRSLRAMCHALGSLFDSIAAGEAPQHVLLDALGKPKRAR